MDNITPTADSLGYQPLVAGDNCPRCGAPLEPGKALFDITMTRPGAAWEKKGIPKLQDCLKCRSCGHSETLTKS